MDKSRFLELLRLPSRGGANHQIHEFIKRNLDEIGVHYSIFEDTTIYNIDDPSLPLFSAHTDTVRSAGCDAKAPTCIEEFTVVEAPDLHFIHNKKAVLGGDDMCGVFIILEMLREGQRFNFVFTDGEETMIHPSAKYFVRNFKEQLSALPYGIVLDRMGNDDIICSNNRYGHIDFEKALETVGKQFGYYPATGLCSDADHIRNVMSCANLSSGYYKAHSYKEFAVWEHMENSHNFAIAILQGIHNKFPVHPSILTSYYENAIVDNVMAVLEASGTLIYR
jgi:hypothetical protein